MVLCTKYFWLSSIYSPGTICDLVGPDDYSWPMDLSESDIYQFSHRAFNCLSGTFSPPFTLVWKLISFEMLLLCPLGPWDIKMKRAPYWPTWTRKKTMIFKSLRIWVICYHSLLWWYLYFLFNLASLDVFNNTKSVQFFISHFSLHHTSCHPLLRTSAIIYAHVKGR